MADPKLCSIDGCGKPVKHRGWCSVHYSRWHRHGNPLGGGTARGAPQQFLFGTAIPFNGDECLIWPYSRTLRGYGKVWHKGRLCLVHRLVCEARYGSPPTPKHDAAHVCGNGHEGCCNPHHVRWATRAENHADKIAHGTSNRGERHGNSKLTAEQVFAIRNLCGRLSLREIAAQFGISQATVSNIHHRKLWAWLD